MAEKERNLLGDYHIEDTDNIDIESVQSKIQADSSELKVGDEQKCQSQIHQSWNEMIINDDIQTKQANPALENKADDSNGLDLPKIQEGGEEEIKFGRIESQLNNGVPHEINLMDDLDDFDLESQGSNLKSESLQNEQNTEQQVSASGEVLFSFSNKNEGMDNQKLGHQNQIPWIIEESDDTISKSPIQTTEAQSTFEQDEKNEEDIEKVLSIPDSSLFNRSVLISEPELITEGYLTTYKLYRVMSKEKGSVTFDTEVLRRFSDFEWLYNELVDKYGGYIIPLLPKKNILTKFNIETENFTKDRQKNLEFFLTKLLSHPKLHLVPQLKIFLCSRNEVFSLVKGEAESQKSLEKQCSKVLGSVKNYFSKSMAKLFSQKGMQEFPQSAQDKSELDELEEYLNSEETSIATVCQQAFAFLNAALEHSKQMEEELTSSHRLNFNLSEFNKQNTPPIDQSSSSEQLAAGEVVPSNYFFEQSLLNVREDHISKISRQFVPQLEELYRNSIATQEALLRRKEIVDSVKKDSQRVKELSVANIKSKNSRDLEMDVLLNNLQKNKQRLEATTRILAEEIQQFYKVKSSQIQILIQYFQEIKLEFYDKVNDINQGRIPNLI